MLSKQRLKMHRFTFHLSPLLFVALMLPWFAQAGPQLDVGALYDYLEPGKGTYAKRIYNRGDSTAFVKVSVLELVYDGQAEPREVEVDELPFDQRSVVASPARMIIPARGMQAVRLLYRGERNQERYYRLRFVPVVPEQDDSFALDETELDAYRKELSAGVQFLAGYGTILITKPAATLYQTSIERAGGKWTVRNEGNATVLLDNVEACVLVEDECDPPAKHHLRPGRTREFVEKPGVEYRFELVEGDARKAMNFKAE
ncbi:MAG TPA: pilus assembly protein [Pseudomonas sp.]|nr:pilus assembly protein [Pseudomonas sp.]